MSWLLLILMSACWAALDATRKQLSLGQRPLRVSARLHGLTSVVFLVAAALTEAPTAPPPLRYLGPLLASAFVGAAGSALLMRALRRGALSLVVPLMALTPAITALGAWLSLDQRPGWPGLAGLALVPVGAFAAARVEGGARLAPGAAPMLIVTLLWSLSPVIDRLALRDVGPMSHAGLSLALSSVGQLILLRLRPEVEPGSPSPRLELLAVALFFCAYGLQLFALQRIDAAVVEATKRAIGLAAALVIGRLAWGERLSPRRAMGVLVLVAGAVLAVSAAGPATVEPSP